MDDMLQIFKKSRHFHDDCEGVFYNRPGSHGYVCVTFRLQGDNEQIILTNYDPANPTQFNEISPTNTEIYHLLTRKCISY